MDSILQAFIETEVFKKYIQEYEVIFIDFGGSRRTGMIGERSDYDIVIGVKDTSVSKLHSYYKGHYFTGPNGEHIHWYLDDFKQVMSGGRFYRLMWSVSNIIRKDIDFECYNQDIKQFFGDNAEVFLEYSLYRVVKEQIYLREILNGGYIKREQFSKNIYRFIHAWYVFLNTEITEEIKNYLLKLKRMRWLEEDYIISNEFQAFLIKAFQDLKDLDNYFSSKQENYLQESIDLLLIEYNNIIGT